jgi:protein TonB
MKNTSLYLLIAVLFASGHLAYAQTKTVKYFSKSGFKEVEAAEAHFFEITEKNAAGGGTKTRFLLEDSSKVNQFTYSNLDGGEYGQGLLNGPYYEWYKSGNMKVQAFYNQGKFSGLYKRWYESGQLYYKRMYNQNPIPDTLRAYHESGSIRRVEVYANRELVSGKVYDEAGAELPFFPMEEMPEFPGGEARLLQWLATNIKYPKKAYKANAQGLVVVTYVVEKDGRIRDAEVIKGIHPDADAEALRVVNRMPIWKPGLQEGEPVPVRYTLPVRYTIN